MICGNMDDTQSSGGVVGVGVGNVAKGACNVESHFTLVLVLALALVLQNTADKSRHPVF